MRWRDLSRRLLVLAALNSSPLLFASEGYAPPSSEPKNLHVFEDHVYFSAEDGIHGRELWRCDTNGKAELVSDITPGSASSAISKFASFGDLLLFRLDPESGGSELWRTDGTAEGTARVKKFNADIKEGFDGLFGIWDDGRAFIRVVAGSPAVWVTDGTEAGTTPLPMTTAAGTPVGIDYSGLIHKDAFYFSGHYPQRGPILARCDSEGRMVEEIDLLKSPAMELIELDEHRLLFRSSDTPRPQELFISGGTAEYTHVLFDIAPGVEEGHPTDFALISTLGERPFAIFSANDATHGNEPWITDGTPEGTRMVADIMPGSESSRPGHFIVEDDRVVFVAAGPDGGKELWMGVLPFVTAERLADIRPGPEGSDPYALCLLPGVGVFFSALDGDSDEELYLADPSRRQVRRVSDIYRGQKSSYPYYTVAFGDMVVFAATDPVHGRELWCASGQGEARLLADIYTDGSVNPSSSPQQLTPAGDLLYFVANDIAHGEELWVSDGTDSGTRLVKDIFPGRPSSAPRELTAADDRLYFTAEDGTSGFRLWQSDGTEDGTVRVSGEAEHPHNLASLGKELFFCAQGAETGVELWVVGPDQPAAMVLDIAEGPGSSAPRNLTVHQGLLYFLADDAIHGEELWRSDGTAEGTVIVRDIVTAPYEEIQYETLAPAADDLYIVAGSGSRGVELWRFDDTLNPLKDIATWDSADVVFSSGRRP